MSYEINVLSIGQKKPIYYSSSGNINIRLFNEIDDYIAHRYFEIFPFFSSIKGIFYTILASTDNNYDSFYSAYNLCDSDFNTTISSGNFMSWLELSEIENLTPFLINEEFFDEVIKIIQLILENSPEKRIMFHTRYQGEDKEIVLGVIKMSKFVEQLHKRNIFFNVCYIIESD